ncbi:hypothetical protein BDC45DRAFT_542405 [Circinella umbellata]|nr:hypothetical protein BDC45DRAFT_542405 [Circinella umbellata]
MKPKCLAAVKTNRKARSPTDQSDKYMWSTSFQLTPLESTSSYFSCHRWITLLLFDESIWRSYGIQEPKSEELAPVLVLFVLVWIKFAYYNCIFSVVRETFENFTKTLRTTTCVLQEMPEYCLPLVLA